MYHKNFRPQKFGATRYNIASTTNMVRKVSATFTSYSYTQHTAAGHGLDGGYWQRNYNYSD